MRARFHGDARRRLRRQKLAQTFRVQLALPLFDDFAAAVQSTISERAITEVDTDGPFRYFTNRDDILLHGWSPFCTSSSASTSELTAAGWGPARSSYLCALLRQQLFVYRELFGWLNDPFHPPPALLDWHDRQLTLDGKTA